MFSSIFDEMLMVSRYVGLVMGSLVVVFMLVSSFIGLVIGSI